MEIQEHPSVISGYPDGTFGADYLINRAEALKILLRSAGSEVPELYGSELLDYYGLSSNPFADLDINEWYAPYVLYAYSHGIVNGYTDGYFRPMNDISFGEMAKILILTAEE